MRAIQITEFGGPEVLVLRDVDEPVAADGLVVLDVTAAGVNYADTHQAENSYLAPARLPLIPGGEVVGTTPDGRRVVALLAGGGYAEKALAAEMAMWDLPDQVSDGEALALVLQGTTAWHLLRTSAQLRAGESVVVHAAAGGVGTIAVQLAKRFGAGRVIAVASSPEKRELALELGADVAVDGRAEDLTAALREANDGRRVDVVLEMAGGRTFAQSLDALAPFGRLVHFGQAGREGAPQVDPGRLMATSRGVIGFWLVHVLQRPELMAEAMQGLLDAVVAGELRAVVGGTYPLAEARRRATRTSAHARAWASSCSPRRFQVVVGRCRLRVWADGPHASAGHDRPMPHRFVILGAGTGGTLTANRLRAQFGDARADHRRRPRRPPRVPAGPAVRAVRPGAAREHRALAPPAAAPGDRLPPGRGRPHRDPGRRGAPG